MVVVEEVAGGLVSGCRFHGSAVDEEDVLPAVVIVVKDGDAGAGGLDDVALGVDASVYVGGGETGFGGYVDEPGGGWVVGVAG